MRSYIVYVKSRRSDPSFMPQHTFAASVKDAISTARGQGFIVQKARLDMKNGVRPTPEQEEADRA